ICAAPMLAQNSTNSCDPASIQDQIAELYANYQSQTAADTEAALAAAGELRDAIDTLITTCKQSLTTPTPVQTTQSRGHGTMNDPYPFGISANSTKGFDIQVTGLLRPANTIIMNDNMFNTRPTADEEYVIVNVTITCHQNFNARCTTNNYDYQLVGSNGII